MHVSAARLMLPRPLLLLLAVCLRFSCRFSWTVELPVQRNRGFNAACAHAFGPPLAMIARRQSAGCQEHSCVERSSCSHWCTAAQCETTGKDETSAAMPMSRGSTRTRVPRRFHEGIRHRITGAQGHERVLHIVDSCRSTFHHCGSLSLVHYTSFQKNPAVWS